MSHVQIDATCRPRLEQNVYLLRQEKRANQEQVRESPRLAARARTRRRNADEQNEDEEEGEEDEGEDEGEEHVLPPRRLRMR